MAKVKRKAIEVRRKGDPDPLNQVPLYSPVGRLLDGRLSGDFGGSEAYARRAARKMERSGRYAEVWIELMWTAGKFV